MKHYNTPKALRYSTALFPAFISVLQMIAYHLISHDASVQFFLFTFISA